MGAGPAFAPAPRGYPRRDDAPAAERNPMVALLIIFLILALIFGIGGAIEISLWFLLLLILAAIAAALLARTLLRR